MKKCSRCGSELQDETRFCNFCGYDTQTESAQSVDSNNSAEGPITSDTANTPVDTAPDEETPSYTAVPTEEFIQKKKMQLPKGLVWKLPLGIVAVLVLIGALTVLAYYTVMPAKWNLLAAETYSFVAEYNDMNAIANDYEKNILDPMLKGAIEQTGQFGVAITEDMLLSLGATPEEAAQISKIFGSATIDYKTSVDYPNKKMLANFGMSASGNPLVSMDMNMDDNIMNMRFPEFSKTWLTMDMANMQDLSNLNNQITNDDLSGGDLALPAADYLSGFNVDPWLSARIMKDVRFDRIAIRDMMSRYIKLIINTVDNDQIAIDRSATVNHFGEDVACDKVTITIDRETQQNIMISILNQMKDDEVLYDQTIGKFQEILDIMTEDDQNMKEQLAPLKLLLNKSTFKKAFTDMKKTLNESYPADAPDITMEVYIKGLQVIRHAILTPDVEGLGTGMIAFDFMKKGSNKTYGLLATGWADQNTLTLRADRISKKGDAKDMLFSASYTDNNNPEAFLMNLDIVEEAKGGRQFDSNISMKIAVKDPMDAANNLNLLFTAAGTIERDAKNRFLASDHDLDFGVESSQIPNGKVNIKAAIKSDINYTATVSLPSMEGETKLDLVNATAEEKAAFEQEVSEKLMQLQQALGE